MLQIGYQHVEQAGLQQQIVLELLDAKHLPYQDEHLRWSSPQPRAPFTRTITFFLEVSKVLKKEPSSSGI